MKHDAGTKWLFMSKKKLWKVESYLNVASSAYTNLIKLKHILHCINRLNLCERMNIIWLLASVQRTKWLSIDFNMMIHSYCIVFSSNMFYISF